MISDKNNKNPKKARTKLLKTIILKKSETYNPNEDILSLDGGRSKRRTKKKFILLL